MDIIITVPHSKCLSPTLHRMCDLRAASAAEKIYRRLKSLPPARFRVHNVVHAHSVRARGDLNRPATRGWAWRRHVQSLINKCVDAGRKVLVLDIHSFPNSSESFGIDSESGNVPHVVLLDHEYRHRHLQLPATTMMRAAKVNDIIVQAMRTGGDALLLEFNEDKAHTPDRYISAVANALYDLIVTNE